jgi:hypothetical protein
MTKKEINNAVNEFAIASDKAEQYMLNNPQQWDSWSERVQFQHRLFTEYLEEIRNA